MHCAPREFGLVVDGVDLGAYKDAAFVPAQGPQLRKQQHKQRLWYLAEARKSRGAHLVGDGERDVGKVLEHADPLGRVVVDGEEVDVGVDVEGVDEVEVGGDLGEDGVRVGLDEGPGVAVGLVRADAGAHEHLGLAGEHEEGAVLRAGGGQGRQVVGKLYF